MRSRDSTAAAGTTDAGDSYETKRRAEKSVR
jgi:hypothetical protein